MIDAAQVTEAQRSNETELLRRLTATDLVTATENARETNGASGIETGKGRENAMIGAKGDAADLEAAAGAEIAIGIETDGIVGTATATEKERGIGTGIETGTGTGIGIEMITAIAEEMIGAVAIGGEAEDEVVGEDTAETGVTTTDATVTATMIGTGEEE